MSYGAVGALGGGARGDEFGSGGAGMLVAGGLMLGVRISSN